MDKLTDPYYCLRVQQLMAKIEVCPDSDCWNWTGYRNPGPNRGYAMVSIYNKKTSLHRVLYEYWVGPIRPGLDLDHLCRNRACQNPDHLQPVPRHVNLARGKRAVNAPNRAKTHCVQGHPFDEANTYIDKGGRRSCRQCHRERERVRWHKRHHPSP